MMPFYNYPWMMYHRHQQQQQQQQQQEQQQSPTAAAAAPNPPQSSWYPNYYQPQISPSLPTFLPSSPSSSQANFARQDQHYWAEYREQGASYYSNTGGHIDYNQQPQQLSPPIPTPPPPPPPNQQDDIDKSEDENALETSPSVSPDLQEDASNSRPPYKWLESRHSPSTSGHTRTKEKYRIVYTTFQRLELEKEFHTKSYLQTARKTQLSEQLGLSERQIKIWFQNRRAKERRRWIAERNQRRAANAERRAAEAPPPPPNGARPMPPYNPPNVFPNYYNHQINNWFNYGMHLNDYQRYNGAPDHMQILPVAAADGFNHPNGPNDERDQAENDDESNEAPVDFEFVNV